MMGNKNLWVPWKGGCYFQKAEFQTRTHQMLCKLKSWVPLPWGPEQMGLPEPSLKECPWRNAWFLPHLLISLVPKATTYRGKLTLSNGGGQYFREVYRVLTNVFSVCPCSYGWRQNMKTYDMHYYSHPQRRKVCRLLEERRGSQR